MRWMALMGVVLFGCGEFPTEIRVNLTIDEALLVGPGNLSLVAFDDVGGIVHTQSRRTGTEFPRSGTLQMQPLDGSTAWIELTLTLTGDRELTREFALVYVDGEIVEHDIQLTENCLGMLCPNINETCDDGECIAAGFCEGESRMCDGGLQQSCRDGVWGIRCE